MGPSAIVLAILLTPALRTISAQSSMDLGASTILIERRGPTNRYIPPVIISSSDAGIARGRARILKGIGPDFVDAQIVDEATIKLLAASILKTRGDGINQANSRGAVEFTVLLQDSIRRRVLTKARAVALLRSLSSSEKGDGIQSSLKGFLDYELPLRTD